MEDKKHPKRIFINDVDKYSSKYIAEVDISHVDYEVSIFPSGKVFSSQFLSSCVVRENSDDDGSEAEAESSSGPGEPVFEIVGTSSVSTELDRGKGRFPFQLYCVSCVTRLKIKQHNIMKKIYFYI